MAKSFTGINNPAARSVIESKFISDVAEEPKQPEPIQPKKETKSKRLQMLIYPSIYKACKEEAERQGESVNEIINEILRNHFTKE